MKWITAVSEAAQRERQSFDERFDMINADQEGLITVALSSSSAPPSFHAYFPAPKVPS